VQHSKFAFNAEHMIEQVSDWHKHPKYAPVSTNKDVRLVFWCSVHFHSESTHENYYFYIAAEGEGGHRLLHILGYRRRLSDCIIQQHSSMHPLRAARGQLTFDKLSHELPSYCLHLRHCTAWHKNSNNLIYPGLAQPNLKLVSFGYVSCVCPCWD